MQALVTAQIQALQKMTVRELRLKWRELYGEDTRSGNRDFLWRRLAWRVQELAYGGLSDRAKARIGALNREDDLRMLPPRAWAESIALSAPAGERTCAVRDPRLPHPGATLSRKYHGQEIRVTVLEDGFEWDGRRFRSLSALAREVTGQQWNGLLFFGLTKREKI